MRNVPNSGLFNADRSPLSTTLSDGHDGARHVRRSALFGSLRDVAIGVAVIWVEL